jgi:hypothetical protein
MRPVEFRHFPIEKSQSRSIRLTQFSHCNGTVLYREHLISRFLEGLFQQAAGESFVIGNKYLHD